MVVIRSDEARRVRVELESLVKNMDYSGGYESDPELELNFEPYQFVLLAQQTDKSESEESIYNENSTPSAVTIGLAVLEDIMTFSSTLSFPSSAEFNSSLTTYASKEVSRNSIQIKYIPPVVAASHSGFRGNLIFRFFVYLAPCLSSGHIKVVPVSLLLFWQSVES